MAKILAIAWKDALVRFASPSELLFFIVLPIIFTLIVAGFAGGGGNPDNRIVLPVADEDGSTLSGDLIAAVESSQSVRPEVVSRREALNRFDERQAPAALIIPAGFEANLRASQQVELDLRADPSNINALAAEQAVRTAIGRVSRALTVARSSTEEAGSVRPFGSEADRAAYFDRALTQAQALFDAAPQRVQVVRAAATQEEDDYNGNAQASAGQLIMWVFIPMLGTAGYFAYERVAGTLRRLLTTPTQKSTFLVGTITSQLGQSLVQMLLLIVFGVVVLKVPWGQSPVALAVVLVSFGLASVAFGTMLGTWVKTPSQANGLAIALGMTMGLLGGCAWPLELFPPAVRTAAYILPTTWAMQAMTDIVMRGKGLLAVLPEAAVLLGYAIVFFVIGVRRFRYE